MLVTEGVISAQEICCISLHWITLYPTSFMNICMEFVTVLRAVINYHQNYVFNKIALLMCGSFAPGEIFVVHNDMGDGWLWVTSQSTGLSGIINRELVQELVSSNL